MFAEGKASRGKEEERSASASEAKVCKQHSHKTRSGPHEGRERKVSFVAKQSRVLTSEVAREAQSAPQQLCGRWQQRSSLSGLTEGPYQARVKQEASKGAASGEH